MATTRKRNQSSMRGTKSLLAAAGVAALAGTAYYFRKELWDLFGFSKIEMTPEVQSKLPIAKDLRTVSDIDGNYDVDGVSFDSDGVIVGSDHHPDNMNENQVHH